MNDSTQQKSAVQTPEAPAKHPAEYLILHGRGPEDYTHSCSKHLAAMLTDATHHELIGTSDPELFCCFIEDERSPEPGELWVTESELLTFLHVVQQGRSSTCLTIRKKTGKVMGISLEGYVTSNCKPLLEKP